MLGPDTPAQPGRENAGETVVRPWTGREDGAGVPSHYRFACFIGLANFICYIDRINISLAIVPLSRLYGWDSVTQGLILSSFFLGYITTQVAGGLLSQRYTGRVVLMAAVSFWSLCTLLTPFTVWDIRLLLIMRIFMGVGEGVSFPAGHYICSREYPKSMVSKLVSIGSGGSYVGIVGGLASSAMVEHDWRLIFWIWGSVGLLWVALFWVFTPPQDPHRPRSREEGPGDGQGGVKGGAEAPSPQGTLARRGNSGEHSGSDDPELALASPEKPGGKQEAGGLDFAQYFSHRGAWAIYVVHFGHNYGFYLMLTWLPRYYEQELGLKLTKSGALASLPYITAWACSFLSGVISDHIITRNYLPLVVTRRVMQTVSSLGPSMCLVVIASGMVTEAEQVTAVLCCALGTMAFSSAGYWVNIIDISSPDKAGTVLGVSNTLGTIPGIVGPALTGWILQRFHSWAMVWGVAILMSVMTWAFYIANSVGRVII